MIPLLIVWPLSNIAQREDTSVSTEKEGLRPGHDKGAAPLGDALVSDVGWAGPATLPSTREPSGKVRR